ncbi:MAG: hypothetical protein V1735_04670 [Nanoarchaeota archaeon]
MPQSTSRITSFADLQSALDPETASAGLLDRVFACLGRMNHVGHGRITLEKAELRKDRKDPRQGKIVIDPGLYIEDTVRETLEYAFRWEGFTVTLQSQEQKRFSHQFASYILLAERGDEQYYIRVAPKEGDGRTEIITISDTECHR